MIVDNSTPICIKYGIIKDKAIVFDGMIVDFECVELNIPDIDGNEAYREIGNNGSITISSISLRIEAADVDIITPSLVVYNAKQVLSYSDFNEVIEKHLIDKNTATADKEYIREAYPDGELKEKAASEDIHWCR